MKIEDFARYAVATMAEVPDFECRPVNAHCDGRIEIETPEKAENHEQEGTSL